jgi:hypothetical protein
MRIKKFVFFTMIWALLVSCSGSTLENPTDRFMAGKKLSVVESKKLEEISGGAASANNPGLLWVHNDSGNPAEIYLVNEKLSVLFTCSLPVENRDWEDIAVGPGPEEGKNYIYLGEIGDNSSRYDTKYIYRFEEPKWDQHTPRLALTDLDTISFRLEGKKKDTETLLLDHVTKDLYIISKRDEPVWLYQLKYPYSTDTLIEAKKVFSLPFVQIVGGDMSPGNKGLLLKNYEHVYFWENDRSLPLTELLKEKPLEVPYELEPQGESIMWARDDSGFYTVSEKNVGKTSYLYLYEYKQQPRTNQ